MRNLNFFIILATVVSIMLASCRILPLAMASRSSRSGVTDSRTVQRNGHIENRRPGPIDASVPTCAKPRPNEVSVCRAIEQQILASTVRLEWHIKIKNDSGSGYRFTDGNTGFATIKEGRYLVTHNHPGVPLSGLQKGELTTISVYAANGQPIWIEGPLEAITIVIEDPETLVLDFGSYSGEGLFGSRGMVSAESKAWESLSLQPGMEVAQIDWDGKTAHVNWVTIEKIITASGTPRLELAGSVRPGASGGGLFWNGYHIANTKSQVTAYDENKGTVLRQYSVAALNSRQVTARLQ
jgi:hypothetical protein